jgi:hypothetical protein
VLDFVDHSGRSGIIGPSFFDLVSYTEPNPCVLFGTYELVV